MKLSRNPSRVLRAGAKRAAALGFGATLAFASFLGFGCQRSKNFTEGRTFAGNIQVDARTLNEGHDAYMQYCYACHGEEGDGKGPASYGLRPPPRDFRRGIFKFARVSSSDELPNDEDLLRIVKGGLHGTPMLPWDIPDVELRKIIQYIKTFRPEEGPSKWEKKKKSGDFSLTVLEPFKPDPDPWTGKTADAVARGKELYHLRAECMNCHPAYDTKEELYNLSVKAVAKEPEQFKLISSFREDVYGSSAKDSTEYAVSPDTPLKIMPPDFLFHPIRSAAIDKTTGTSAEDIYRIISYGIYPVMPKWKGAGLSEADIWALAHYVKFLADMKGTPAAAELKEKIATQAVFTVPAPAPPPDTTPAGEEAAGDEKKDGDDDAKADDAKKDDAKKDGAKKEGAKKEGGVRADDPVQ